MAYGFCIVATAILQMVYGTTDFLPVFASNGPVYHLAVYVWDILWALSGVAMLFNIKGYTVSLVSAGVFLLLLFLVQIPHTLFFGNNVPFEWAPVQETSAFAGCSLIMAGSYSLAGRPAGSAPPWSWLEKLIPYGGFFFSVLLVVYGIDHFVYIAMVATFVPAWMPGSPAFWTYFCGAAMIAAGIAITLKIQLKLAGCLLAMMFFLWCIMVHIPRVLQVPVGQRELELTRVFLTFGFTGISLLIAFSGKKALRTPR